MSSAGREHSAVIPMNTHDQLFAEWRSERPEYNHFSDDGILVDADWEMADVKIAYILKESNDGFLSIRGSAHGPSGSSKLFWRNLRMWRYVVRCHFNGSQPEFKQALFEKEQSLSDVAYINLKKNGEWRSTSNDKDIRDYVARDWTFLNRQIENIDPDVIFCCGSFKYIVGQLAAIHITGRIFRLGDKLVINFYHPSGRKSYRSTFDELVGNLAAMQFLP